MDPLPIYSRYQPVRETQRGDIVPTACVSWLGVEQMGPGAKRIVRVESVELHILAGHGGARALGIVKVMVSAVTAGKLGVITCYQKSLLY